MRRRLSQRRRRETSEVNITAFLSLMVVLVPFLLVTSVFSQMAILELQFEDTETGTSETAETAPLEVIVREREILVIDEREGRRLSIPSTAEGYDLERLSLFLHEIKSGAQSRVDAIVLMEPQLSYETLIDVVDVIRHRDAVIEGVSTRVDLFPQISIGDAPPRRRG